MATTSRSTASAPTSSAGSPRQRPREGATVQEAVPDPVDGVGDEAVTHLAQALEVPRERLLVHLRLDLEDARGESRVDRPVEGLRPSAVPAPPPRPDPTRSGPVATP